MKKTIYNASLEESQNFVNQKYIDTTVLESEKKVVRKRFLGVCVANLLLVIGAFFVKFIEKEAPGSHIVIAGKLNPLIYLLSFLLFIYYINRMMDYKNKKVLNSYYFNQTMLSIFFFLITLLFLFTLNAVLIVTGIFLFIPMYILLFLILLWGRLTRSNQSIINSLYKEESFSEARIFYYLKKIEIFAKRYGAIVIIGLYLIKRFSPSNSTDGQSFDIVQQVSVGLSPFISLLIFYFLIAMREQVLQGYYLKKYIEEYRLLSGYSIEEWYGPKSKKYQEEMSKHSDEEENG